MLVPAQAIAKAGDYAPNFDWAGSAWYYGAAANGFVTPAKSQGRCGCCYAFAAVAAVESRLLIQKRATVQASPVDLSEQMIVSATPQIVGRAGLHGPLRADESECNPSICGVEGCARACAGWTRRGAEPCLECHALPLSALCHIVPCTSWLLHSMPGLPLNPATPTRPDSAPPLQSPPPRPHAQKLHTLSLLAGVVWCLQRLS